MIHGEGHQASGIRTLEAVRLHPGKRPAPGLDGRCRQAPALGAIVA